VTCRSLGADLPADALVAAIRRTAPAALLLWSQLAGTADPDLLTSLPRTRPAFRIFIGGPGWADVIVGPRVVRLSSLQEATDAISAVASTPPLPNRFGSRWERVKSGSHDAPVDEGGDLGVGVAEVLQDLWRGAGRGPGRAGPVRLPGGW
jgi:hypothetical protein